jgi:hypothetical protein
MEEMRHACKIVVGKPERKDHLGDLDIGGRRILKCTGVYSKVSGLIR